MPADTTRTALEQERDTALLLLEKQGLMLALRTAVQKLTHEKQQELLAQLHAACSDDPMPGIEDALQVVTQAASPSGSLQ